MWMGQGVKTGLGHGGITCVLQTQFSSFIKRHHGSEIKKGTSYGMTLVLMSFILKELYT